MTADVKLNCLPQVQSDVTEFLELVETILLFYAKSGTSQFDIFSLFLCLISEALIDRINRYIIQRIFLIKLGDQSQL